MVLGSEALGIQSGCINLPQCVSPPKNVTTDAIFPSLVPRSTRRSMTHCTKYQMPFHTGPARNATSSWNPSYWSKVLDLKQYWSDGAIRLNPREDAGYQDLRSIIIAGRTSKPYDKGTSTGGNQRSSLFIKTFTSTHSTPGEAGGGLLVASC